MKFMDFIAGLSIGFIAAVFLVLEAVHTIEERDEKRGWTMINNSVYELVPTKHKKN